eukprot:3492756-Alexandrium_andersonii.AAC.2
MAPKSSPSESRACIFFGEGHGPGPQRPASVVLLSRSRSSSCGPRSGSSRLRGGSRAHLRPDFRGLAL